VGGRGGVARGGILGEEFPRGPVREHVLPKRGVELYRISSDSYHRGEEGEQVEGEPFHIREKTCKQMGPGGEGKVLVAIKGGNKKSSSGVLSIGGRKSLRNGRESFYVAGLTQSGLGGKRKVRSGLPRELLEGGLAILRVSWQREGSAKKARSETRVTIDSGIGVSAQRLEMAFNRRNKGPNTLNPSGQDLC